MLSFTPQALKRFASPVTRQVLLAVLENERYYYQLRLRAAQMVEKLGTLIGPNWTGALSVPSLSNLQFYEYCTVPKISS